MADTRDPQRRVLDSLLQKLYFECYWQDGARHVLARLVTSARTFAAAVAEHTSPSVTYKHGGVVSFIWRDDEARLLARDIGPRAVSRLDNATGC